AQQRQQFPSLPLLILPQKPPIIKHNHNHNHSQRKSQSAQLHAERRQTTQKIRRRRRKSPRLGDQGSLLLSLLQATLPLPLLLPSLSRREERRPTQLLSQHLPLRKMASSLTQLHHYQVVS
ncbi:hypothetical protein KEM55_002482, partial [Ascosphaera atra]